MNKTKVFISIFVFAMLSLSVFMGYVLSQNMRQDSSLLRGKLTKEYKEIKSIDYIYNESNAQRTYSNLCSKCHGVDLKGNSTYPSLVDSKITKNHFKLVKILSNGLNKKMPAFNFIPNKDITDLINFLQSEKIDHKQLLDLKLKIVERNTPWTKEEL